MSPGPKRKSSKMRKWLHRIKWPILFVVVLAVVGAAFYAIAIRPRMTYGIVSPAWLGNTYELAGALFSAFAFAGVILTVLMQAEELRLQRIELRATRKELKRSAGAQEKSERILFLTAYLNTCNGLLNSFQQRGGEAAWQLAYVQLATHLDAVRESLANAQLSEILKIAPQASEKMLIQRIARYVAACLTTASTIPQTQWGTYLADCSSHVGQLLYSVLEMLDREDPEHGTLIAGISHVRDLVAGIRNGLDDGTLYGDANAQKLFDRIEIIQLSLQSLT